MNGTERPPNQFDRQLWNRFVAIAQPYWFPSERGDGWVFLGLLLLSLMFLFAALFVLVSGLSLGGAGLFPDLVEKTAGGLVQTIRAILNSSGLYLVVAGLIVPAGAFYLCREKLRSRWEQWGFLLLLLLLSLSVSGMNVTISFVGNFFTTALAEKDAPTFWRFFWVYAGVFATATPIVVFYTYVQDLLGLRWRAWMTGTFLERYFQNRTYYEIESGAYGNIDNPDQRIAQDIDSFTNTSLSFLLLILGSVIDVFSFTGILWAISPNLAVFLIGYAVFGTIVAALLGRRLITLNFNQLRREADFRYGLVRVRDNAESIAFYRGESREMGQLQQRFLEVLRNFSMLIGWQRNLGFFRTPYRYLTYILPSVILAPMLFAGDIKYGVLTQAGFAFSQIFDAFALFVLQINQLSTFAAGINRLEIFTHALNRQDRPDATTIDTVERDRLALEHVTLKTPNYQRDLVTDLSVAMQPGDGLVIVGQSGAGKSSLLRAIAGLWNAGTGKIVRPQLEQMLFLPQRPYMILGSLRAQLQYPLMEREVPDAELRDVLHQVNLAELPDRVGGFDAELDWADLLSLGEQQRLAFARLLLTKPAYAVLDEATSALDLQNEEKLYQLLRSISSVFVSVGHRPSLLQYHKYVLELTGDTQWRLLPTQEYQPTLEAFR